MLEEHVLWIVLKWNTCSEPLYKCTKWISAYLLENKHISPGTYVCCAYCSSQIIHNTDKTWHNYLTPSL